MGCSASRIDTFLAKAIEDPSSCSLNPSSSSSSSSSSTKSPAKSPAIPKTRCLSAPMVHHPAVNKGDTHHLVCLTSSTYGSLVVVDVDDQSSPGAGDFSGQSSPDSVINTWELMRGLEEEEDGFNLVSGNDFKLNSLNSCDFHDEKKPSSRLVLDSVKKLSEYVFVEMPQEIVEEGRLNPNSKPLWKYLSEESLLSKMDPNVASSYQRALSSRKLGYDQSRRITKLVGCNPYSSKSKSVGSSPLVTNSSSDNACRVPFSEDKIVLYFTSLRGIRRTYEDCSSVRMILRGFRVMVDERDISMDSTYRKELQSALGGKALSLPQLFIRGKHIGGGDEIKQLHETGELERLLDGFPIHDRGFVCERCGDARFIPCSNCNGSRKVFQEEEGRTRRCPDCNENGLVRCPGCCS